MSETTLDSLLPDAVAQKAENVGVKKGNLDLTSMFMLALLAGAFIAIGAIFCTVTVTGIKPFVGFGITKLLGGLVFCIGLVLVVVAGAELFTGNNLIVMATLSGKLPARKLMVNWGVVFAGNFIGSVLTAYIMYLTLQYKGAGIGNTALNIGAAKCNIPFVAAFARGIMCNALVCLAVWLTFSCRTTGDKIMAILFPITAFVAAGFEHCVANMYFVPIALFVKNDAAYFDAYKANVVATKGSEALAKLENLTWGHFLVDNLVPVTLGNIVGGVGFVAVVYWVIFLHTRRRTS